MSNQTEEVLEHRIEYIDRFGFARTKHVWHYDAGSAALALMKEIKEIDVRAVHRVWPVRNNNKKAADL